ncbi:hypothetical protein A2U01_0072386, partial [Trifolium medium]|nr:hypothetical protein [Trifolium medium]
QLRLRFELPRYFDFNELSVFKFGQEFVIGDIPSGYSHDSYPLSRDKQPRLRFQLPHHFDFNELSLFKLGHEFVIGDFPSVYPNESNSTENSHFMKKVVA